MEMGAASASESSLTALRRRLLQEKAATAALERQLHWAEALQGKVQRALQPAPESTDAALRAELQSAIQQQSSHLEDLTNAERESAAIAAHEAAISCRLRAELAEAKLQGAAKTEELGALHTELVAAEQRLDAAEDRLRAAHAQAEEVQCRHSELAELGSSEASAAFMLRRRLDERGRYLALLRGLGRGQVRGLLDCVHDLETLVGSPEVVSTESQPGRTQ